MLLIIPSILLQERLDQLANNFQQFGVFVFGDNKLQPALGEVRKEVSFRRTGKAWTSRAVDNSKKIYICT